MITKDSIARFCHIEHHIIVAIEELLRLFSRKAEKCLAEREAPDWMPLVF